jgi:hypothetical protein
MAMVRGRVERSNNLTSAGKALVSLSENVSRVYVDGCCLNCNSVAGKHGSRDPCHFEK